VLFQQKFINKMTPYFIDSSTVLLIYHISVFQVTEVNIIFPLVNLEVICSCSTLSSFSFFWNISSSYHIQVFSAQLFNYYMYHYQI